MNLKVTIDNQDDEMHVSVEGEIDAYTAPKLREALLPLADKYKPNVTVSLKGVSYMDSTGLGVFVGMYKAVDKNGGHLNLVNLSDRLDRLFTITGLSDIINISCKSEGGM